MKRANGGSHPPRRCTVNSTSVIIAAASKTRRRRGRVQRVLGRNLRSSILRSIAQVVLVPLSEKLESLIEEGVGYPKVPAIGRYPRM